MQPLLRGRVRSWGVRPKSARPRSPAQMRSAGATPSSIQPRADGAATSTASACSAARLTDVPIRSAVYLERGHREGTIDASSGMPIVPAYMRRTSAAMANTHPPAWHGPLSPAATTGAGWSKTARKAAESEVMKRSVYSGIRRRRSPLQVDAGREALACAGDDHRPVEVPDRRDDRVEQLDVEGVTGGRSNRP